MRRPLVDFNLGREDLEKMFGPSNEVTVKSWEKKWLQNIFENLQMHPVPRPLTDLLGSMNRHVVLVCGAGPSLRKLPKRAKLIPPDWGVVCVDSAVQQVLDSGLKPTLVVSMDGDQHSEDSFGAIVQKGFDTLVKVAPETPVLLDIVTCPSVVKRVKNPFFFRNVADPKHIIGKYTNRECPHVPQMGHGGNVGSVCLIMAKFYCMARHAVLIGMDSAMQEGTARTGYWYDVDMPDRHQYFQVADIYGRPITTMANLHNYKWWNDHYCFFNDDVEWINANDGGFLGVCNNVNNYNHFKYLTVEKAVEYLKDHGVDD